MVKTLPDRGLILKRGTIVESTIISAPSSTKNKDKQRDFEAHSVKKGTTWYFGYKAHVGVDKDSGIFHSVEVMSANVRDVEVTSKLLTGEGETVHCDSGYVGAEKRRCHRKEPQRQKRSNIKPTANRLNTRKIPIVQKGRSKEENAKNYPSEQKSSMYLLS